MPKKLALLSKIAVLAVALAAMAAGPRTEQTFSTWSPTPTAQSGTTCPRGEHLVVCPTYSFCCPNNAFCVCGP